MIRLYIILGLFVALLASASALYWLINSRAGYKLATETLAETVGMQALDAKTKEAITVELQQEKQRNEQVLRKIRKELAQLHQTPEHLNCDRLPLGAEYNDWVYRGGASQDEIHNTK